MTRPRLEVADVVRAHGAAFLAEAGRSLSSDQRRVLDAIARCRTAALGGHVEACDHCGRQRITYNSCRNRHCPKCQAAARAQWMQERSTELLPVPYFHVVFTLPDGIGPLALQNPRCVYGLLFQAAAETLLEIAADPQHLGARIGFLAILHTWGQNLMHHPHLHCLLPGGGFAADSSRWISCRRNFFMPVRILSRVFRGKVIALLKRAYHAGRLRLFGRLATWSDPRVFDANLNRLVKTDWVVHAKPPFGGPQQVLKYLARYTHRVAISNDRLLSLENGQVQFEWKDYANGNARKTMTLSALEFLRRFLLHVLPKGFVKIRSYGYLGNRVRLQMLALARRLLKVKPTETDESKSAQASPAVGDADEDGERCTACRVGRMKVIERLMSQRWLGWNPHQSPPARWDTS